MVRDFLVRIRLAAIGFAVAVAIGAAPLTACGVKGPLKLPSPASTTAGAPPSAPPEAATAGPAATPATLPSERKP